MASQEQETECLTCTRELGADCISDKNEEFSNISDLLRKYFWFTEVDFQRASICQTCWDQVKQFHQFYVSVEDLYHTRLASVLVKYEPAAVESGCLDECVSETSIEEEKTCSSHIQDHVVSEDVTPKLTYDCTVCLRTFRHSKVRKNVGAIQKCRLCKQNINSNGDMNTNIKAVHPDGKQKEQQDSCQTSTVTKSDDFVVRQLEPDPELNLQDDSVCSRAVKEEPALEIVDENDLECMVASDEEEEAPQLAGKRKYARYERKTWKQLRKEDDYIREHVKFICKWCGEDSPSFTSYVKHSLYAHGNKSAFIECCGKKYFRKDRMYQHVQVVNNPDTYRCKQCPKNFNYKHALILHMKQYHKVGGEFKCDRCDRTFPYQSQFARHFKTHQAREARGPKPRHPCTDCEKTFSNRLLLKDHFKAIHMGISPYNCPFCERVFISSGNMHRHKKAIHPDEWKEERQRRYAALHQEPDVSLLD